MRGPVLIENAELAIKLQVEFQEDLTAAKTRRCSVVGCFECQQKAIFYGQSRQLLNTL